MPAKHVHNDGKISALLIADASGANRFYVVAHCEGGGGESFTTFANLDIILLGNILITCLQRIKHVMIMTI